MQDYLWRLALVLPLVLLAAVAVLLLLHRRQRGPLPGWLRRVAGAQPAGRDEPLVLGVQALTPAARVAVLRFHGREHLVGLAGNGMVLIASADRVPAVGRPGPEAGDSAAVRP